ncbi:Klp61F [Symbiodinium natans]|uniref:Klp61F protein n=1 Tax=Symbiodinium natans TaxID=878477 RepID=A0A812J799_9DINO|nr:Klp61F [Symbiodinium natans]
MGQSLTGQSGIKEELPTLHILAFCDWAHRAAAPEICHGLRGALGFQGSVGPDSEGEGYWRFLCERLAEESEVYVPCLDGVAESYQSLFKELYLQSMKDSRRAAALACAKRDGTEPDITSGLHDVEAEEFKIGVAARLRPADAKDASEEEGVVLPLHQKVQLVKKQLGCSSKEALSLIMRKQQRLKNGGKDPIPAELQGCIFQPCRHPGYANKENVPTAAGEVNQKTAADDEEDMADARCSILSVQEEKASLLALTKQSGLREYTFDRVFGERSAQADVFTGSARRLVMEFLNGTSASIICYGQTASGKTHTMFGPPQNLLAATSSDLQGLVPRTCAEVLQTVETWRQRGVEVHLSASYVELFGSEVSDLLREGQVVGQGRQGRYAAVRATDRVGHRYVLDGHTEYHIESLEEVYELLQQGEVAKRRAATAMNERSTRAHTVFVLSLSVQRRTYEGSLQLPARRSRFYFADLGGSEQLSKSKVEAAKAKVTVVGGEEQ